MQVTQLQLGFVTISLDGDHFPDHVFLSCQSDLLDMLENFLGARRETEIPGGSLAVNLQGMYSGS